MRKYTRAERAAQCRRLAKQLSDLYDHILGEHHDAEASNARLALAKASDQALIAAHWLEKE